MAQKPELVIQDVGGIHNADMEKTAARLMKGGSWKKQRVIVVIPAGESIPAKVYLSHCNIAFPPNNGVLRILAQGMEVGEAYSSAIESIMADPNLREWEFLLTLEHDNVIPFDGVLKLIETLESRPELAAVSGLYFCKGEGGCAHIWGDVNDPIVNYRPQIPRPDEVVECCGLSMGFTLYRLSMFKDERLRKPWFKTLTGIEGQGIGTQDLFFWGDARKHGYRCAVDCRVRVGHYEASTGLTW